MDKKNFFESIKSLPLVNKLEKIYQTFAKPEEKSEADNLAYTFILRDKEMLLLERQELLKKYFPNITEEEMVIFVEQARKKPKNLKNQLHLMDYMRKNIDLEVFLSKEEENIKILILIASFLTHKLKGEEYVDKKDCNAIEKVLNVKVYPMYADQLKRIVHLAFRFQKQRIKKVGACFLHGVATEYKAIDIDILLNLLEEFYLSDEAYEILDTHFEIITEEKYPAQKVVEKLRIIDEVDKKATLKEKDRLQRLINRFDAKIATM